MGALGALEILLSHWRILIFLPLSVAVVAAAVALTRPEKYRATTVFVPEASGQTRMPASLAGLAGQFGINLGSDGGRSPAFYAEIAKSRDILARVLLSAVPDGRTETRGDSATLLAQYAPEGDSTLAFERGLRRLERAVSVEVDIPTGLVSLSVTDHSPEVAAAVANRLVGVIDDFNTDTRQSQARRRREFVDQRVAEAGADLRRAERALDEFQDRNRSWQQSPQLSSTHARLRRELDLRQEVYLTLSRELETARIEEVNDAPVISVVQSAAVPKFRAAPRRGVITVIGGVLGVLLALCWIGTVELFRRLRAADSPGYHALRRRFGRESTRTDTRPQDGSVDARSTEMAGLAAAATLDDR